MTFIELKEAISKRNYNKLERMENELYVWLEGFSMEDEPLQILVN
jgi:hypothetical protein